MQLSAALPVALALSSCTAVSAPEPSAERRARARDGVELAYEERGAGEPLLVFVHGWCGDRGLWRATLDALAPRHHVLALDLAGHGASGANRASWTLDALADDVVAVVDASGANDVILIGHSMGATVSVLAAARLAPRVRGVIGIDSLHSADFVYPPEFLAQAVGELEADFPGAVAARFRSVVPASADPELLAWLEARAAHTDRAAAIGLLRGLADFRLGPALAAAGVPVRVIASANSKPPVDVEQNRRWCDFDALTMDGVGHFPMLERPDAFLPLLEHWIAALSSPAGASAR